MFRDDFSTLTDLERRYVLDVIDSRICRLAIRVHKRQTKVPSELKDRIIVLRRAREKVLCGAL